MSVVRNVGGPSEPYSTRSGPLLVHYFWPVSLQKTKPFWFVKNEKYLWKWLCSMSFVHPRRLEGGGSQPLWSGLIFCFMSCLFLFLSCLHVVLFFLYARRLIFVFSLSSRFLHLLSCHIVVPLFCRRKSLSVLQCLAAHTGVFLQSIFASTTIDALLLCKRFHFLCLLLSLSLSTPSSSPPSDSLRLEEILREGKVEWIGVTLVLASLLLPGKWFWNNSASWPKQQRGWLV
jgi:hypothetical protein